MKCKLPTKPLKIVCHSKTVIRLAIEFGWLAGASYTNLRDIRGIEQIGLIDVDWKRYDFKKHLQAVKSCRPILTIAKDVLKASELNRTLEQGYELLEWSQAVIVVPKAPRLGPELCDLIPSQFILGYSVPTRYGGTKIPLDCFRRRPVHLLGGRPDVQRQIAERLTVVSLDVNRFTLDARYGDFFDGEIFRPHPRGGYHRCLRDSLHNINALWSNYQAETNGSHYRKSKTDRSNKHKTFSDTKQSCSRFRP